MAKTQDTTFVEVLFVSLIPKGLKDVPKACDAYGLVKQVHKGALDYLSPKYTPISLSELNKQRHDAIQELIVLASKVGCTLTEFLSSPKYRDLSIQTIGRFVLLKDTIDPMKMLDNEEHRCVYFWVCCDTRGYC